jgi:hypothetical protein
MTWLLWLGLMLSMLAAAPVGLSAYGERRWAGATQALQRSLEAGRIDDQCDQKSPPTRYDVRELEGLPAPVQRYLRAVLKDGQPIITAVTIDLAGTFNMSPMGEQWKPFTSRQRVFTRRPGPWRHDRRQNGHGPLGRHLVQLPDARRHTGAVHRRGGMDAPRWAQAVLHRHGHGADVRVRAITSRLAAEMKANRCGGRSRSHAVACAAEQTDRPNATTIFRSDIPRP